MNKYSFYKYSIYGKIESLPISEALNRLIEGQPVYTVSEATGEVFFPKCIDDLLKD